MKFVKFAVKLTVGLVVITGIISLVLAAGYVVLFVVGTLRMSQNYKEAVPEPGQPAIVFVVDVSKSMETSDMATSSSNSVTRIAAVKHALADFVKPWMMPSVGLVSVSGGAVAHALPGCSRLEFLKQVEALNVSKAASDGDACACNVEESMTAIGDGMAAALSVLRGVETTRERVIVLISDGLSNAGKLSAEEAFDMARGEGVHVYAIGIKGGSLKEIAGTAGGRFACVSDESSLCEALANPSGWFSDSAKKAEDPLSQ